MAELIESGRIVDLILALTVVEALALAAYRWRTGRGPAPFDVMVNLAAGVFLLLALRAALSGASWEWIAAALFGSLIAHLADLARRWSA